MNQKTYLSRWRSPVYSWAADAGRVRCAGRRTSEMHRTQDSYVSVLCKCRAECSMEASACAWGVGDLECRSAAKPCRLPMMFCGEALQATCTARRR